MDYSESATLTTVKTPWWWHTWSVETCRRRFCASVVYIFLNQAVSKRESSRAWKKKLLF